MYCSPVLQAAPGSTHGYDVVDPSAVSAELGGEEGWRRLLAVLREHGLAVLLDIVPNHMAIRTENRWWWDVLENGPSSRYATYFDVDWDPPESRMRHMVLLPVLHDHYGRVLEAGGLRLEREGGAFRVRYQDHLWPVAPWSLEPLLAAAAERAGSDELGYLGAALGRLPLPRPDDRRGFHRRHRDKQVLQRLLDRLLLAEPALSRAVDEEVERANHHPDALDAILEGQNYRLAYWRTAARDLGYRRFFDVNDLIALRVEDERVFAESHALVLSWVREGWVDGLRVDHPDGLRDPQGYLQRLRGEAPRAWIVAEKILMPGESLRESWPVDGTTGYDFAARVGGLFVDPAGEAPLTALYEEFTGEGAPFAEVARESRRLVMRDVLGSDLNRLTALLMEVCESHRRHRDYTRHELHAALAELVVGLPVYRTYAREDEGMFAAQDRAAVKAAVEAARARADADGALLDFIGDVLTLQVRGERETELAVRFQQLCAAAMAKGVEDTAFYRYHRLVALNEVGGDPGGFGVTPAAYHQGCQEAWRRWPATLAATSTHDSKRGEDVRARLALLSEIPADWAEEVRCWARINQERRGLLERNTEYLFYQTLVGAWPLEAGRAVEYMRKAAREAKAQTSWIRPQPDYEEALEGFVRAALADAEFVRRVEGFVEPLVLPGRLNSLAQTLLKLTAPGVPDIYQGCELWCLTLVDPDNRRPVDYALRRRLQAGLGELTPEQALAGMAEGLPKLWLIQRALALRRRRPEAFGPGEPGRYHPLECAGSRAAHAVAHARGDLVVALAPRLVMGLGTEWADTTLELPPGRWRSVLTGEAAAGRVPVGSLLSRFPVALLERDGAA